MAHALSRMACSFVPSRALAARNPFPSHPGEPVALVSAPRIQKSSSMNELSVSVGPF